MAVFQSPGEGKADKLAVDKQGRAVQIRKGKCIITSIKSMLTITAKLLRKKTSCLHAPWRWAAISQNDTIKITQTRQLESTSHSPAPHPQLSLCLRFPWLKYVKRCLANVHKVWHSKHVWDLPYIPYQVDLQMGHGHLPRTWQHLAAGWELLWISRDSGQMLKVFQYRPKFLGRKRNHHMWTRPRHTSAPITCLGIIYPSPALLNKAC